MQRRKFLIGAGSLAAAGAAGLGTGAFSTVQADRSVDVSVADDSNAFLALDASESDNNAYADVSNNAVRIDLDSDAGVGGDGVNTNAVTQINDIFKVKNKGAQAAVVYVDPSSISSENRTTTSGFGIDPQASNRPNGDYTNVSGLDGGVEDDQISLTGLFSSPPYEYSAYNEDGTVDDATEEFVLEPGESFDFGLYVDTRDGEFNGTITMEIVADATVVPDSYAEDSS